MKNEHSDFIADVAAIDNVADNIKDAPANNTKCSSR